LASGEAVPIAGGGTHGDAVAWSALAACVAIHAAIFLPLVAEGDGGRFGHDYALHFPNLLAGYFHFLSNGPFSVPWFSPAQCGGIPFLADLNVAYYSLPQWLAFAVGPVAALQATFVGFAGLGAAGFYLLARRRFDLSPWASLTAAVLFLFNGFFAYRMAAGHLTFHPFMLSPWLAWLALPPMRPGASATWPRLVLAVVLGAAILAYEFQSGMVHAIIPAILAVGVIVLVHGHLHGHAWQPWTILAAASALSVALSAQRLSAAIAFLDAFPRTLYPLPGFANPLDAARIVVEALFWRPPAEAGMDMLTNSRWHLGQHEWEYGVGPAAAVLLLAGAVALAAGLFKHGMRRDRAIRGAAIALAIAAVILLPLAVNWYTPDWNAILKRTPIFGSSVGLIRWFMLFIPLAALAAGLAFDRVLPAGWPRTLGVVAAVATTVGWNAFADKDFYTPRYDGAVIVETWRNVRSQDQVPPISRIAVAVNDKGEVVFSGDRNNTMAFGASQLACYQPMFGYGLEAFPLGGLHPGMILDRTDTGDFNFKNPACYLFPDENGCRPGDHFRDDQVEEAILLAQYLDFPFRRSTVQNLADYVNAAAVILSLVAIALAFVAAWRRRGLPQGRAS
jgi:hypothetical protein